MLSPSDLGSCVHESMGVDGEPEIALRRALIVLVIGPENAGCFRQLTQNCEYRRRRTQHAFDVRARRCW